MAHITPFRALRYDPQRVALPEVVTQPYDKITPEMQERYYGTSPHNLVRIILGKRNATDAPGNDVYSRAAGYFEDWRKQGVLLQDPQPSIYRYTQQFTDPDRGIALERRGFIALGRVEDYSAGIVFRHEQTLAKPKADRLELLRATRAHFGQIFMLYSDPGEAVEAALATSDHPDVKIRDEYGVVHQLWKASDPQTINCVSSKMMDKKLIIADGHHRYETALAYRNERRTADHVSGRASSSGPLATYEFVMMTFINMDAAGLLVLPTHRVVHGLSSFSADIFRESAKKFFSVEEADAGITATRATAMLRQAGQTGPSLLAVTRDRAFLLNRPKAGPEIFGSISLPQQSLDVVQLHKCLLERALGISEEAIRNQQNVSYIRDAPEAMNIVRSGRADIAFLMNPVRMQQVRDLAFAGETLPQKSTDFYPKLLSGLTIYVLD